MLYTVLLIEPSRLEICFPFLKPCRFSLALCAAMTAGEFALNSLIASWQIPSNQNFGHSTEKKNQLFSILFTGVLNLNRSKFNNKIFWKKKKIEAKISIFNTSNIDLSLTEKHLRGVFGNFCFHIFGNSGNSFL